MKTTLFVALGGAVGSAARHLVGVWVHRRFEQAVALPTAIVNISGCALIGVLTGLIVGGTWKVGLTTRAFVFVGILGGFTTFSSFGLDTLTLVRENRMGLAGANVAIQVGVGLAAVFAGYKIGHA